MKAGARVLLLGAALSACATRPAPVSKIVGGRVVVTRAISPSAYEHVARALILEEEERWEEAARELQRAVLFDDEAPEIYAHLAEIFMRIDRLDDAAAALRASFERGATVPGLVARARLHQIRGDARGAVTALREATKLTNFRDDAAVAEVTYLELAQAELVALDAAGARRTLEVLAAAAPSSTAAQVRLAAVAWAMGDLRAAEGSLKEALREEPNHLEAWLTLAWLHVADAKPGPARVAFREALDRSEGAPDIAAAFVRFLVTIGAADEAAALADDLASPALADADAAVAEIEIERSAKRLDRALALARRTRDADATAAVKARMTLVIAELLDEKGSTDEAVKTLLGVAKGTPGFAEARLQAAEILRDAGKTAEALRALADVEAQDEDAIIELEVARAQVEEKAGEAAKALRRLEAVAARYERTPRIVLTIAALEERRGQWRRALSLIEPLLSKDPGSVEALNFWGFVAVDHAHDLPLATKRLRAALALEPGSAAILDSVGWAHFRAGEMAPAALFLEQAGRLMPEDPEILGHLGELYVARGERARAVTVLRKALKHDPEDRLRRRLEEELARAEAHKAAGR